MSDRRAPRDQGATTMSSETPHQRQARLQREAAERRAFTQEVLAAVADADARRAAAAADWPALASRAYSKLQYDLPVVATEELRALLHVFR